MKRQVPSDPGDAFEEGADAAAEPGSGHGGAGAAGLDGEAADGEGETVGGEVETAGARGVDQVVALADRAQERGDRSAGVRLQIEMGGAGLRQVAPAGAAGAAR